MGVGLEAGLGYTLVAGMDLDHNGIREWAASTDDYYGVDVIRIFEGMQPVAERFSDLSNFNDDFGLVMTAGDMDGDGFGDLVFTIAKGSDSRLQLATTTNVDHDEIYATEPFLSDGSYYAWEAKALVPLPAEAGTPAELVTLWFGNAELRVTQGALPATEDTTYEEPFRWQPDILLYPPGLSYLTDALPLPSSEVQSSFVVPTYSSLEGSTIRVCPPNLDHALDLDTACPSIAVDADGSIGARTRLIDLDQDGKTEIASTGGAFAGDHGVVRIYDLEGTEVATIQGTMNARLIAPLHTLVDDLGESWLLIGTYDISPAGAGVLYAFRGSDLSGELTEADAERVYTAPDAYRFFDVADYRETDDGPLFLLLSDIQHNTVYRLPFDPPEPFPP